MAVELPAGYHLKNFLSLIGFVKNQYSDLLVATELSYGDNFLALSSQAQSLYVRMILRKGPVFRSDKLKYDDVPDINLSAKELSVSGFLNQDVQAEDVIALHSKIELQSWVVKTKGTKKLKRPELVELVTAEVDVLALDLSFEIYRPLGLEILQLYQLLFFGNLNQDFSEFVLTDMGMLRYETYSIPETVRLYGSRSAIDQTWLLYELRDVARDLIENKDFSGLALFSEYLSVPGNEQVYDELSNGVVLKLRRDRLFNDVARHLERHQFYKQALSLYSQSESAPSRERQARILNKQGDAVSAFKLCEEILLSPENEQELEFSKGFSFQLSKQLPGKSILPHLMPVYETIELELYKPEPFFGVEESVRLWLESDMGQCFYVENNLVPGLFGLCFWDIIFAPVNGVFVNPFQRGPLDLFTSTFCRTRAQAIVNRMEELVKPDRLSVRARVTFSEKKGIANHFVNWETLTVDLLDIALTRIPGRHIMAMFSRLLFDLRSNRSGFPDLIYFPEIGDNQCGSSGTYQMIEVKGPGDQLQHNQKRWIKAFAENDIPFKLAKVKWTN